MPLMLNAETAETNKFGEVSEANELPERKQNEKNLAGRGLRLQMCGSLAMSFAQWRHRKRKNTGRSILQCFLELRPIGKNYDFKRKNLFSYRPVLSGKT